MNHMITTTAVTVKITMSQTITLKTTEITIVPHNTANRNTTKIIKMKIRLNIKVTQIQKAKNEITFQGK